MKQKTIFEMNLMIEMFPQLKDFFSEKRYNYIHCKHLILTFNLPTVPKSVHNAYFKFSVHPYIPNPLRCFKRQIFVHTVLGYRGAQTCERYSLQGHDSKTCSMLLSCVKSKDDLPHMIKSASAIKKKKRYTPLK